MSKQPEHIGDTIAAKNGKLENNQEIKGLPNGPCDKCGSNKHDTAGHGKVGGARAGGGRKPGGQNVKTREREAVLEAFRLRVQKHTDRLFNAQANLATGEQYLYCKTTTTDSKGKQTTHTEIVTDPETIRQYLDGELDDSDDEYYYISTKPANNMAIDSLLNRAFGTPNKNIDLKGGVTVLDRMDDKDVQRIATALGAALSGTDDDTDD